MDTVWLDCYTELQPTSYVVSGFYINIPPEA